MISPAELDRIVALLVAGYAPDAIGLFGSHALGIATDRSDLDLAVIKQTREAPRRRAAHVRHLLPTMYKVDVVVLTPDELAQAHLVEHSFHDIVARQFKLIYLRPGVSPGVWRIGRA